MDGTAPNKRTILVVDDQGSMLYLARRLLQNRGYDVVTLGIGTEKTVNTPPGSPCDILLSHEQLRSGDLPFSVAERIRQCDAIVTDYQYGEALTGIDLMEQVRRVQGCSKIPVLLHSTRPKELLGDEAQMKRAVAVGITTEQVLSKDSPMQLPDHIQRLLDSTSRERA